ncbi:hypothetical protein BCR43DRAFT_489629 [Syncephalastrum racemosum]|uniref:Sm domain-containing protein n=1 Tax=Syncephalastrum racemosum TaxID=13706 RepID=A0A1X2HEF6_SYNRA|nr:hypothetical protein BCR43DRAFT_489629 [Syncephalastrum racemosum]
MDECEYEEEREREREMKSQHFDLKPNCLSVFSFALFTHQHILTFFITQMSDRGNRGQHRGGDRGRGRGGGRGGRGGHHSGGQHEKPKKESILDLSKYMNKKVRVRFNGGREVVGSLQGYDPLLNLVLDDTIEYIKDLETGYVTEKTRELGLTVLRGTAVIIISPFDGSEEIENPFVQAE